MGALARFFGFDDAGAESVTAPADVVEERSAPEPSSPLRPPQWGDTVSESGLLSTINVYRAVQLLALGAGQLTIDVWRGTVRIPCALASRPDIGLRDLSVFTKTAVSSLALTGNAFWRVTRNDRHEAVNIEVLNPHECEPLKDGTLAWSRQKRPLQAHEFQHLGLLWIAGRPRALGPVQAARQELAGAMKTTRYGAEFHDSGDVPSGILKTDQVLSAEQSAQYKSQWMTRQAHEVAVLGAGLDYKPVLLNPKDAQFIESRQFDTTAIARLFGIPPHMFLAVVEGGSRTYQNMAQADLAFLRWTLMDYLREIETAFSAVLPSTQTARFNTEGLLRADTLTRYQAHEIGIRAGFLDIDEVRDIEGLPPREERGARS